MLRGAERRFHISHYCSFFPRDNKVIDVRSRNLLGVSYKGRCLTDPLSPELQLADSIFKSNSQLSV